MPKINKPRKFRKSYFSKGYLLVFLVVFALAGFVIYRLFATTNPGILEAESMRHYSKTRPFADQSASGEKAIKVDSAARISRRYLKGSIRTGTSDAWLFGVIARARPCHGHWPRFTASVVGQHATIRRTVRAMGWQTYSVTGLNVAKKKNYSVHLRYTTRVKYRSHRYCYTNIYFDAVVLKAQPVAISGVSSKVSQKKATITATMDNHNQDSSYYVEYGTSTDYGLVTGSVKLQAKSGPQTVNIVIDKLLKSNTTYHYRVCADNNGETFCTEDATFRTNAKGDKDKKKSSDEKSTNSSGSRSTCFSKNTHDIEKNNPCPLMWKQRQQLKR